jgi:hypothetical protein
MAPRWTGGGFGGGPRAQVRAVSSSSPVLARCPGMGRGDRDRAVVLLPAPMPSRPIPCARERRAGGQGWFWLVCPRLAGGWTLLGWCCPPPPAAASARVSSRFRRALSRLRSRSGTRRPRRGSSSAPPAVWVAGTWPRSGAPQPEGFPVLF